MGPSAPARGPAQTSPRRWIVFVVDHWLGAETSHPKLPQLLINHFSLTLRIPVLLRIANDTGRMPDVPINRATLKPIDQSGRRPVDRQGNRRNEE